MLKQKSADLKSYGVIQIAIQMLHTYTREVYSVGLVCSFVVEAFLKTFFQAWWSGGFFQCLICTVYFPGIHGLETCPQIDHQVVYALFNPAVLLKNAQQGVCPHRIGEMCPCLCPCQSAF